MIIRSADKSSQIQITRNDDANRCAGLSITGTVSTNAGVFTGANDCVHISLSDIFLNNLRRFIASLTGEVFCDATEDCFIRFFRWNGKGDIGVECQITKFVYSGDPVRSNPAIFRTTFPLDSEYIGAVERDFLQLLDPSGNLI